jgi:hypothetical protein
MSKTGARRFKPQATINHKEMETKEPSTSLLIRPPYQKGYPNMRSSSSSSMMAATSL